jgi:head-tail adaptor
MSFDSRLVHRLIIERSTAGAVDDYNQPTQAWATMATVPGLVQPKTAQEVPQLDQAGAVVSTHTIFVRPTDVLASDRIRFEIDDGRRFEIDGIRDAAGLGHHLEIDARVVGI